MIFATMRSWLSLILVAGFLVSCESIPKKRQHVDLSTLNTPDHISDVEDVERLLIYAQGYYDLGDYESALHSYNQVLTVDPSNIGARRGKSMSERAMGLADQDSFLDYRANY